MINWNNSYNYMLIERVYLREPCTHGVVIPISLADRLIMRIKLQVMLREGPILRALQTDAAQTLKHYNWFRIAAKLPTVVQSVSTLSAI